MKTNLAKHIVLVAVAGLLLSPAAFAQPPKKNLSIFKGNYTGPMTFVSPSDSATGIATVVIKAPKNGKTATISYSADVAFSGGNSTLPTEITLARDKTVSVTDLGVGVAGTNNAHRGTGTYSQRKRTLTFTATNGDIVLTGTAIVRDTKKKRKLQLTLVSTDAGGSTTFTNTLRAKLPRIAH